jgi:hypothetical protein
VAYVGGIVFGLMAVVVVWTGIKKMRSVNRIDDVDR